MLATYKRGQNKLLYVFLNYLFFFQRKCLIGDTTIFCMLNVSLVRITSKKKDGKFEKKLTIKNANRFVCVLKKKKIYKKLKGCTCSSNCFQSKCNFLSHFLLIRIFGIFILFTRDSVAELDKFIIV